MEKYFWKIVVLILLIGCNSGHPTKPDTPALPDTSQQSSVLSEHATESFDEFALTLRVADTAVIMGQTYIAEYWNDDKLYVFRNRTDTVLTLTDYFTRIEFDDFNGDGFDDLRLGFMSNTPGIQDLYLFDKTRQIFRMVEGFNNFPDPNRITGTKFYYSYHKSGCADMNWGSELFYLEKFHAKAIGKIDGYQCRESDKYFGLYIYKSKGVKFELIETLPIDTIWTYKDSKWGFIKDYWSKSYKKFL